MLVNHTLGYYGFEFDNWGATPSATPGSTITASGTAHTKGSWTQLAANTDMTSDGRWIYLSIFGTFISATQTDLLVDIGIDPAGGTSYTTVIPNLIAGETANSLINSPAYLLPLYIPAGASVAARSQSNAASRTAKLLFKIFGGLSNPEVMPTTLYAENLGANTANSQGVSFTPGNAAWGSYTSLGTTSLDLSWVQLGVQMSTATAGSDTTWIELAIGDGTNFRTLMRELYTQNTAEQIMPVAKTNLIVPRVSVPVIPAGSTLYVRGFAAAAPTAGYNACAIGMGA